MKKLLLTLFVCLSAFNFSFAQKAGESVMTFTTSKTEGQRIQLTLKFEGELKIEGVKEKAVNDFSGYTLTGSEVKITGDLREFSSVYQDITGIDVSAMPQLTTLDVYGNPIENIEIKNNTELKNLLIGGSKITELHLNGCKKLEYLNVNSSTVSSIDFSDCESLKTIFAKQAGLTSLDLKGLKNIDVIDCGYNKIQNIDLSVAPTLKQLSCAGNGLKELNLKGVKLMILNCNVNNLTSLDLSEQTELEEFGCISNNITALDFTNCKMLFKAVICSNKIKYPEMTELCKSLRYLEGITGYLTAVDLKNASEGNECSVSNVAEAKKNNWLVCDNDGGVHEETCGIPYAGRPDEELSIEETECAKFDVHYSLNEGRIYVAGAEANSNITICDMNGRTVYSVKAGSEINVIDVTSLTDGIYMICNGGNAVKFVVK